MLHWLPLSRDFKSRLNSVDQHPPGQARCDQLVSIARQQLSFLEYLQLDRAIGRFASDIRPHLRQLRLALIGSSTHDHLIPMIRVAALRRRMVLDCYTGGYGQFRQDAQPGSQLHAFRPQVVVLSLAASSVLAPLPPSTAAPEVDSAIAQAVDRLRSVWTGLRTHGPVQIIQQNFLNTELPLFGSADRVMPAAPSQLVTQLNIAVAESARKHHVQILDIAGRSQRDGLHIWFDYTRKLQAKQDIAPAAAPMYGELVARIIAAQLGMSKKCLVLDLDNTLWGGVLGDDGVEALILGQGSALGEAFADLQRYALSLARRGVMLAICSKNDQGIAEAAFSSHPEMVLRRNDITAFVANWNDKPSNLLTIATQLNINVESLVLLDDSPVEREQVRAALPDVGVPELAEDASTYAQTLSDAGYFESVFTTTEDLARGDYYVANAQRAELRANAAATDDFLRDLEMKVICRTFDLADLPRITQLINKTNQFTTTTTRYSEDEVKVLAARAGSIILSFRLSDRIGDNGLVSAMIMLPSTLDEREIYIDTWVMSCRVFGRGLEHEALNSAVAQARKAGYQSLIGAFKPTVKNGVISELFQNMGFTRLTPVSAGDGTSHWRLQLDEYNPTTTHILREGPNL